MTNTSTVAAAPQLWDDPLISGRNRVLTHSPLGAYPDARSALQRADSPFRLCLNGQWKFRLTKSPLEAPEGWLDPALDDSTWGEQTVPSNWQLDPEVDDQPVYTNWHYAFAHQPPTAPQLNPTGWYRTTFQVPEEWQGREVFLHLESCDSACQVWVNGREVGYSEDSKLPHEFNLTEWLQPGVNQLAVMVPRYCSGYWLECQDYWHLSGIQRDVTLYSKPRIHLRDFTVRTVLEGHYTRARVQVRAYLNDCPELVEGYQVRVALHHASGELAAPAVTAAVSLTSPMYQNTHPERGAAWAEVMLPEARLWSAEDPYLYTAVLTLLDPAGQEIDFESTRVGVREVGIADRQLKLNGQRMMVRGVNWHEHHPERGRALTIEDMRANIVAMKQLNFNAIRTSHYPHHSAFYDLCDELGMYVVDEANLETHGLEARLSKDPLWAPAYLERAQRMALRDKNHPSIICWSLGNESFYGPHHAAMKAWLKSYDPTRPVQYESGDPGPEYSDIMPPMYPKLDWVEQVMADAGEHRPMIMCEYAYSKGNAQGNFAKYWQMVERYPAFQGGFIWDWADKALVRMVEGRKEWAYGNEFDGGIGPDGFDYGKTENPQMCLNGVVLPDLQPKPGAWEIKKVQAPVQFKADGDDLSARQVKVVNRYLALTLDHLEMLWEVLQDGVVVQQGSLPMPSVTPGAEAMVTIPGEAPGLQAGSEYHLNLRAVLKGATPWAPAGHEVAWEQFALPFPAGKVHVTRSGGECSLNRQGGKLVVQSASFEATFDLERGVLSGLGASGAAGDQGQLLAAPLEHCFMRARTDNDYITGLPGYYDDWMAAGLPHLKATVLECAPFESRLGVVVTCLTRHQGEGCEHGITCRSTYAFKAGQVGVEVVATVDPGMPVLPRIGMRTALPAAFSALEYYGRGPHENYRDRKLSALLGRYQSSVQEQFFPFIDPSECGGHEDVRWLELRDQSGGRLRIEGCPTLHFSALPYAMEELLAAGHVYELPSPRLVHLHLDGFHMGMGGDTGWTRNVHPEYLLTPGTYRYGFTVLGFTHPSGEEG